MPMQQGPSEQSIRLFLPDLLVSTATLAVFVTIACGVQGQNGLTDLDLRLAEGMHYWAQATPGLRSFFEFFTQIGSPKIVAALPLGLAVILLWRRQYCLAATCILAVVGGKVLEWQLQDLFQRQRPPFVDFQSGACFPSGGAMGSMICYGLIALILPTLLSTRSTQLLVGGLIAGLVLAIGLSRFYIGWHWLTDILAGFAAGAGWLAISRLLVRGVIRRDVWHRRNRWPQQQAD